MANQADQGIKTQAEEHELVEDGKEMKRAAAKTDTQDIHITQGPEDDNHPTTLTKQAIPDTLVGTKTDISWQKHPACNFSHPGFLRVQIGVGEME
jgi:hypothetical protein